MNGWMNRETLEKINNILINDEKLNDDCIMALLFLMNKINSEYNNNDIIIIDSQYIGSFMIYNDQHPSFLTSIKILNKIFKNNNEENIIYLIPINDNDHWSLLIYIEKYLKWYHFDSFTILNNNNKEEEEKEDSCNNIEERHFHKEFIINFLKKLVKYKIFVHNNSELIKYIEINSKIQNSNWEGGQYLLMYSKLIINYIYNNKKLYNCKNFEDYIKFNINYCDEENRKIFIKEMLQLINENLINC